MKCDRCNKDCCSWTELHSIHRIDMTPNCYHVLNPVKPKKEWICYECLGVKNYKEFKK
jgi:hypothetical protein